MSPSTINATSASLLGFLHDGPASGWDLLTRARDSIGHFWSITPSQVYRELTTMARDGLVEPQQTGPRERRPYALTPAGRAAFAAWLNTEPGAETIRYPLLLTMTFGRHLEPGRLAAFVRAHRAAHADRLSGYHAARAHLVGAPRPDPFALATLAFGIRYEQAVLDWCDEVSAPFAGDPPT